MKADHTKRECGNFDVLNKRAAFASAVFASNLKPAGYVAIIRSFIEIEVLRTASA